MSRLKYNFIYTIANENNSASKDYNGFCVDDYLFTSDNLKKVLSALKANRKSDEPKIAFIKDCMPDLPKIEAMMQNTKPEQNTEYDIVQYYTQHFAPAEIKDSSEEITINIRFFMNKGEKKRRPGDAIAKEIRIFIKGFPDTCKSMVSSLGTFSDAIEGIPYGKALWFENYLRHVLAHELFHILHMYHYNVKNEEKKEKIVENSVGSSTHDSIGSILMEVFAEYFATAYMKDYLRSKYSDEEGRIMLNQIVDFGNTRLFGIGRKKLLENQFDQTEIEEDEKQWNKYRENKSYKGLLEIDPDKRVCNADYYGAYVLSGASGLYYDGKQGNEMPYYVSAYDNMINGKRDMALADLIRWKEEYLEDLNRK